jgi:Holliday junction resolvase RusA-like endonuclease
METKILLHGEPKSTQHIYGLACRGRFPQRYMTPAGKALKEQYQWEARAQWKGKPLVGDVEVSITLYFGTKRKADLDNFNKISLDALTGIVWEDDSQIAKLTIERGYDKGKPRLECRVSDY